MSTTTSTDASEAFAAIFTETTDPTTSENTTTQTINSFIGPPTPPHLKPNKMDETKEIEKKISKAMNEKEEDMEIQTPLLSDDDIILDNDQPTTTDMNDTEYDLLTNDSQIMNNSPGLLYSLIMQNTMQNNNIPITSRLMYEYKNSRYHVSSCEMQGHRDSMEDKHLIHFKFNGIGHNFENVSVFGIFDGHGGDLVSKFIQTHFISILEANVNDLDFDDESVDAQNKIRSVFKQLDEKWIAFENECKKRTDDDIKENDEIFGYSKIGGINDYGSVGSTMIVCIVKYYPIQNHFKIITINVGDSRAILLQNTNQSLIELSVDHKPDDVNERTRICNANGFVHIGRVNGDLALSRAIGDTRYKQSLDLPAEEQQVIYVPDITYNIAHATDCLLMYCDGIVEYKSNLDVSEFYWEYQKQEKEKSSQMRTILEQLTVTEIEQLNSTLSLIPMHESELMCDLRFLYDLTQFALDSGSRDNMTCMAIQFQSPNETSMVMDEMKKIWVPAEYYVHEQKIYSMKMESSVDNNVDDVFTNDDGNDDENNGNDGPFVTNYEPMENMKYAKFMELFEEDCNSVGFEIQDKVQYALLLKILYANDLISNSINAASVQMQLEKLIAIQTKVIEENLGDGQKEVKMDGDMDGSKIDGGLDESGGGNGISMNGGVCVVGDGEKKGRKRKSDVKSQQQFIKKRKLNLM